jgi:hypothetical protein
MADAAVAASSRRGGGETTRRVLFVSAGASQTVALLCKHIVFFSSLASFLPSLDSLLFSLKLTDYSFCSGNLDMGQDRFCLFSIIASQNVELEWYIVVTELGSLFLFMFFINVAAIALTLTNLRSQAYELHWICAVRRRRRRRRRSNPTLVLRKLNFFGRQGFMETRSPFV